VNWIKLSDQKLPPQGLKILAFNGGDCWICYRFSYRGGSIWVACVPSFAIPDVEKFRAPLCNEPEYWSYIPFDKLPGPYTGLMKVAVAGADAVMTFDEIEQQFPDTHKLAIQNLVNYIENELERT
jgi:hypothetical protein